MDFMGILVVFGDGVSKPIQDTIRKAARRPVQAFLVSKAGKGSLMDLERLKTRQNAFYATSLKTGLITLGMHGVVQELNGGAVGYGWL